MNSPEPGLGIAIYVICGVVALINLVLVRKRGPRGYVMAGAATALAGGTYFWFSGAAAWQYQVCFVLVALLLFIDASIRAAERQSPKG